MSIPNVLITGGAGYIGSQLTNYLLCAGCRVVVVDSLIFENIHAIAGHLGDHRFRFVPGDVRDSTLLSPLMSAADVVIPLAALVGAPICQRKPQQANEVNAEAVRMLVKMASKKQRILLPNTNSAYGSTGEVFCTEDALVNPISVYAKTKMDGEKSVLDHPNSVSFRLATVFGVSPRMRFDLMVNDFTESIPRTCVSGNGTFSIYEPHFNRNYVHIRDVCRAFMFMMARHFTGIFNLGLPTANLTKLELAHKVCEVLHIPKDCVRIGAGKDTDQRNYLVSNDKLLNTKFTFEHSLEDGIKEVAQYCEFTTAKSREHMRNF